LSRLSAFPADGLSDDVRGTLDQIGTQFGFVPNMFNTLASNPAVLDIVMTLQTKANRLLDAKTRHAIALAVSEANGCDYCLALHTAGSRQGGMSVEDIDLARAGSSIDPRRAAVARFSQRVIETRGHVSDADLAAVRGAGYTDPQVLAIVALAVRALLTNYLNNVNQTDVDIPAPARA
jgi:uncharacterized peroxidase-related enzyme